MVDVIRISEDGVLLEIKRVSDKYREKTYIWKKKPKNHRKKNTNSQQHEQEKLQQ
jgi:hypothetical protein